MKNTKARWVFTKAFSWLSAEGWYTKNHDYHGNELHNT